MAPRYGNNCSMVHHGAAKRVDIDHYIQVINRLIAAEAQP